MQWNQFEPLNYSMGMGAQWLYFIIKCEIDFNTSFKLKQCELQMHYKYKYKYKFTF
mgnify:FL=1